jgi:SnoaL-like protein
VNLPYDAISDQIRIEESINRLFVCTDSRDWSNVRKCFAPVVRIDMSSVGAGAAREMTPEQITDMWEDGLKTLEAIHHQVGNHLVSVDANRAIAFCYGTASHYLRNASGRNTRTFVGSYDFELEKIADHWAITMMRFNLKYLEGNPDLEKS